MRANAIMDLVRRLLTHEASENLDQDVSPPGQDALIEAAERVVDKLRVHLSKRIGQEGFRTLLARALFLMTRQFPSLSTLQVGEDGSLVGLRAAVGHAPQNTQDNVVDGTVAFVTQFFGLLIAFIGEDLTRRMLSTVWPELAWDDEANGKNEVL